MFPGVDTSTQPFDPPATTGTGGQWLGNFFEKLQTVSRFVAGSAANCLKFEIILKFCEVKG